jgi:hypothetical protein
VNREEAAKLLALIALGDNRQTTTELAAYWHGLLQDIRLDDATQAVAIHRRESTEWLQPSHIIRIVRAERAKRIDAANIIYEPIGEETARDCLARIAAITRAAGDGRLDPRRIGRLLEPGPSTPTVPNEIEAAIEARKAIRSALTVHCPFCHAAPRSACKVGRNANGKPAFIHPARMDAVRAPARHARPSYATGN